MSHPDLASRRIPGGKPGRSPLSRRHARGFDHPPRDPLTHILLQATDDVRRPTHILRRRRQGPQPSLEFRQRAMPLQIAARVFDPMGVALIVVSNRPLVDPCKHFLRTLTRTVRVTDGDPVRTETRGDGRAFAFT